MVKCPARIVDLKIRENVAEKIRAYARLINSECYGALLGDPETNIIEDAYLYWGQRVTGMHIDISENWVMYSDKELKKLRPDLEQLGWWHSHYDFGVFDSGTDYMNTDQEMIFQSYTAETEAGQVIYVFYSVVNQAGDLKAGVKVHHSCGFKYQVDIPVHEVEGGPKFSYSKIKKEIEEKVFKSWRRMPPEPYIQDDPPIPIDVLLADEPEIKPMLKAEQKLLEMKEQPKYLEFDEFAFLVELASKYNFDLVGYTKNAQNLLNQAKSRFGGQIIRPGHNFFDALNSLFKVGRNVTYRPGRKKDG